MSDTVGSLRVMITANAAGVEGAVAQTQASLARLGKSARQQVETVNVPVLPAREETRISRKPIDQMATAVTSAAPPASALPARSQPGLPSSTRGPGGLGRQMLNMAGQGGGPMGPLGKLNIPQTALPGFGQTLAQNFNAPGLAGAMGKLTGGAGAANKAVVGLNANLANLSKTALQGTNLASAGFFGLTTAVLGYGVAIAGVAALAFGVKLAADAEMARAAFETMTGSAKEAAEIFAMIEEMAVRTPFTSPELVGSGKELMAMGVEADNLKATLTALGDIASISGMRLQDLSEAYGKVAARGEVNGRTLEQFARYGINLREALGKVFGKTSLQVEKMVSEGKVGFDSFKKAMEGLVNEGGRFHGGMERASKTVHGLASTIQDNLQMSLKGFGEGLIEGLGLHRVMQAVVDVTDFIARNIGAVSAAIISHWPLRAVVEGWMAIHDTVIAFFDEFKPEIEAASEWVRLFGKGIMEWAEVNLPTARTVALSVLKTIAYGIAYTVDVIKVVGKAIDSGIISPMRTAAVATAAATAAMLRTSSIVPGASAAFAVAADKASEIAKEVSKIGIGGIEALGDALRELGIGESADAVDRAFNRIGQSVVKAKAEMLDLGHDGSDVLRAIAAEAKQIGNVDVKGLGVIDRFQFQLEELRQAAGRRGLAIPESIPGELKNKKFPTGANIADRLESGKLTAETMKQIKTIRQLDGSIEDLGDIAEKALLEARFEMFSKALSPLQRFQSGLKDLDAQFGRNIVTAKQYGVSVAGLVDEYRKATGTDSVATGGLSMMRSMGREADALRAAFAGMAAEGRFGSLGDFGTKMLSTSVRSLDELQMHLDQMREHAANLEFFGAEEEAKRLLGVVEALDRSLKDMSVAGLKKVTEIANSAMTAAQSPLDQFRMRLEDLQTALSAGKISNQTFGIASAKAFESLAGSQSKVQLPPALLAGSSEAVSVINRFQAQGPQDVQTRIEAILRETKATEERHLKISEDIKRVLERLKFPEVTP